MSESRPPTEYEEEPSSDATRVEYSVISPERYKPPEGHEYITSEDGTDIYYGPDDSRIDKLETADVISVRDWGNGAQTNGYENDKLITGSGPPEPVVREDEKVEIVYPTSTGDDLKSVELGRFECLRCGVRTGEPVELGDEIQEPHVCPGCDRKGPFQAVGLAETDLPPEAIASPLWQYRPSGASDERYDEIWDDIRDYIYDHWDAKEEYIYEGLTAYAITTWVRPDLTFVPHLLLMGSFTGGKTRLLNTLARVSYRALVSASATPASMFRLIDQYNVTFYISEYHGLGYETRELLDNVVRAGQKRGEVITRAESTGEGHVPAVFDPFTHVAIASQFEPKDDVISRCVRVSTSPADRDMPATHDESTAQDIRNRMLYARYRLLDSDEWADAEREAYAYLAERDIDGRTREKLLAIVTAAILWDRTEEIEQFVDAVVEGDQEATADSTDAMFVEAVRDLAFDELENVSTLGEDSDPFAAIEIPLSDVADRYNAMSGQDKSSAWAGQLRARLDLEKTRKADGTMISDPDLGEKLRELCAENNLEWERSEMHDPVRELDDNETYRKECSLCGNLRTMAYRHAIEGYHMCSECADEERAHHQDRDD